MSKKSIVIAVIILVFAVFFIINKLSGPSNSVTLAPFSENLLPLSGKEIRYLAFQIFTGGPKPEVPFETEVSFMPKEKISVMVQNIIDTIGTGGSKNAKLAFVVGPISFDLTDQETRQLIRDSFSIALEKNIAVGFHIDDSMFWKKRQDLMSNPANVEWIDWNRTLNQGLKLDWAKPPAKMCFNSPEIVKEVARRAKDVIGDEIANGVRDLKKQGRGDLFAGVIAGWETHMGQDIKTDSRLGYCALTNRGFNANNQPKDISSEVAAVVQEFIDLWASSLAKAGIQPNKIYSHVAFLPKLAFENMKKSTPNFPNVDYSYVVDANTSTARPSVAFGKDHLPGFSTYPTAGIFDQIYEELAKNGNPHWASSEGTNLIPGGNFGSSGMNMESYLARMFNHGATLVDIFAWGIGGEEWKKTFPFRIATEGDEAIAAYRKFLNQ